VAAKYPVNGTSVPLLKLIVPFRPTQ
jgi:hypothetical protein